MRSRGIWCGELLLRPEISVPVASKLVSAVLFRAAPRVNFKRMESFRELGRVLFFLGGAIALIGAFLYLGGQVPGWFGRLPGDMVQKGEHTTFYFPVVSCLLLSVGVSLLFWLVSRIRR